MALLKKAIWQVWAIDPASGQSELISRNWEALFSREEQIEWAEQWSKRFPGLAFVVRRG